MHYHKLQQCAILISIISIIYNGAEGGVSIGFGFESSSRALVFFGIQSGIEVISAIAVLWRFRKSVSGGDLTPKEIRYDNLVHHPN
jgi:hypothetical protein